MATAASFEITDNIAPHFVTAVLHVEYLKPLPSVRNSKIRGHVIERSPRKAVVELTVTAGGTITVRANAVAVRIPQEHGVPRRSDLQPEFSGTIGSGFDYRIEFKTRPAQRQRSPMQSWQPGARRSGGSSFLRDRMTDANVLAL